jgi:hypothetical protein
MRDSGLARVGTALVVLVLVVVYWIAAANISDGKAYRAAQNLGLTDITVESSTIWFVELRGCSDSDEKRWVVSGVNAQGVRVTFNVCGGVFKGATVRSR